MADQSPASNGGSALEAVEPMQQLQFPDPTPEMLADPRFEAIWQTIKTWDINVPGAYVGYCGATGNHVRAILDAVSARSCESAEADGETGGGATLTPPATAGDGWTFGDGMYNGEGRLSLQQVLSWVDAEYYKVKHMSDTRPLYLGALSEHLRSLLPAPPPVLSDAGEGKADAGEGKDE